MYLVELRPGKEELYRTGDDLAAAIRRGDVDVHSRIYHRATSKWISITLHPQYKAITSMKPPAPPAAQDRGSWTYLNAQSETLEVHESQPEAEQNHLEPEAGGAPPVERQSRPWRRLFALSVAGLALLFGVQLAFSGPRPPWSGRTAQIPAIPAAEQDDEPGRNEQVISLASTSAWSDESVVEEVPAEPAPPEAKPHTLPRAPAIRVTTLDEVLPAAGKPATPAAADATVESLIRRYTAAHDSALSRLASGIRVARLNQMLAAIPAHPRRRSDGDPARPRGLREFHSGVSPAEGPDRRRVPGHLLGHGEGAAPVPPRRCSSGTPARCRRNPGRWWR